MQLTTTEEDTMNERTTNLTPDTPTNKSLNSDEFNFLQQFYIAEGSSGLLAHAACGEELENINDSVIASAAYSIQDAIGKMNEIFHGLLDHSLALQRQNKGTITVTETILETGNHASNINEDDEYTSPKLAQAHDTQTIDFDWTGIEGEFNHHHMIAKGIAGTLFLASAEDGYLGNPLINGAAYSIECALKEMDKMFEKLYPENTHIDMDRYDEFSDHYALAKSVTGLLFCATQETDRVIDSFHVNPAAYSIESALKEMNKLFQSVLKTYLDAKKPERALAVD